jgi:hypothetical protein
MLAHDDVRHHVLVLFPQPRTARNVSEEESDRATWQRMCLYAYVIWPDGGCWGWECRIGGNIAGKIDESDLIGWCKLECVSKRFGQGS